jgi:ABC-type amino acid transport substrate-binding protein
MTARRVLRAERGGRAVSSFLFALLAVALAGCGEEPTPPRLTGFAPAEPSVAASETVDIRVEYEANDFRLDNFQWTAEAGEIEDNGKPEITYRAPDAAGDYKLTVTASVSGEDLADLTLDTVVKVLPAPEPAPAPISEAEGSEAAPAGSEAPSAGQAAAEAARAALEGAGQEAAEPAQRAAAPPAQAETGSAQPEATAPAEAASARTPDAAAAPSETTAAQTTPASDGAGTIVDRGRFTAAVEINFKPFSFTDEAGRRVGFDVDMMREFARRWLDDPGAVTFLPVTPDRRIPSLEEGKADLIAAAMTKNPARQEAIDFSLTYFKDGQRLLVAEDSDIAGPCDLAGKKVAVVAGTTSIGNIKAEATTCGFDIEDDLVVFDLHEKAIEALLNGEVEAFTSDGKALERFAEGKPLKVVGNHFSEEPYGFGIPKGDDRLRQLVNLTMEEMAKDGAYAAIYKKWFGDELSPYPLEGQPDAGQASDQQLASLAVTDVAAIFEPPPASAAPTDYVVQAGDTLSRIAGKVWGDVGPNAWRRIYEANKAAIGDNPNRLEVGMRLTIPATS